MPSTRRPYPSDLTDEEWDLLEPLLASPGYNLCGLDHEEPGSFGLQYGCSKKARRSDRAFRVYWYLQGFYELPDLDSNQD